MESLLEYSLFLALCGPLPVMDILIVGMKLFRVAIYAIKPNTLLHLKIFVGF